MYQYTLLFLTLRTAKQIHGNLLTLLASNILKSASSLTWNAQMFSMDNVKKRDYRFLIHGESKDNILAALACQVLVLNPARLA